ncbi:hypothetical protein [Streptomyces sp. NPDC050856]|uniref:hypothetical protein n=1 Tax=Streptomyces sp. NPDC050856 TaxID=3154939 RepID=UPI0034093D4A
MSTPTGSDPRQDSTVLTTTVVIVLGVALLLGAAVFVTYIAWQHPRVVAPLNVGATFLGAVGAVAAAIVAALRRRP